MQSCQQLSRAASINTQVHFGKCSFRQHCTYWLHCADAEDTLLCYLMSLQDCNACVPTTTKNNFCVTSFFIESSLLWDISLQSQLRFSQLHWLKNGLDMVSSLQICLELIVLAWYWNWYNCLNWNSAGTYWWNMFKSCKNTVFKKHCITLTEPARLLLLVHSEDDI